MTKIRDEILSRFSAHSGGYAFALDAGLRAELFMQNGWGVAFCGAKRGFDIFVSFFGLSAMALVAVALVMVLNPLFNPGPLFYRQVRMGQGGKRFEIWKFRTMDTGQPVLRKADDDVEQSRITPLGKILRKYRIDELPNFINVLRSEMSLVGPRPDMVEHAMVFARDVPRYAERFRVKPGITGLAQVRQGYAAGVKATMRKARLDHIYVQRACFLLEMRIIALTVLVVLTGFRAR